MKIVTSKFVQMDQESRLSFASQTNIDILEATFRFGTKNVVIQLKARSFHKKLKIHVNQKMS